MKRQIHCILLRFFSLPVLGTRAPFGMHSSFVDGVFYSSLFYWFSSSFFLLTLQLPRSDFRPLLLIFSACASPSSHTQQLHLSTPLNAPRTFFFLSQKQPHRQTHTHQLSRSHAVAGVKEDQQIVMLPDCLSIVVVTTSWGNKRWRISLLFSYLYLSFFAPFLHLCSSFRLFARPLYRSASAVLTRRL